MSLDVSNGIFTTFLGSLGCDELEVIKLIPVTVFPEEGGYAASFMDANISTCGETAQDAVSALQELIAEVFLIHEASHGEELGPKMKHQTAVLADFVCRTSRETKPKTS